MTKALLIESLSFATVAILLEDNGTGKPYFRLRTPFGNNVEHWNARKVKEVRDFLNREDVSKLLRIEGTS